MTWAVGYGLFIALTLACVMIVRRGEGTGTAPCERSTPPLVPEHVRVVQWLRWVSLAFIPSSLMLGVTMYLTTDIAAIPLLWVVPLAIYLLSFILTFARRPMLPHSWMIRALPMAAVLLMLAMSFSSVVHPALVPLHLLSFFLVAMVCHGELVQHRPAPQHLTAFYLAMACGGVLGGLFNALIAPMVFDRVVEYPLALVLACLVLPQTRPDSSDRRDRLLDLVLPAMLGVLVWGLVAFFQARSDPQPNRPGVVLVFGLAALVCYTFKERPIRFALGIGAVMVAGGANTSQYGQVLYQHRDYFGVLRVTYEPSGSYHQLIHGHTLHGQQSLDPKLRREPLTYYHRTGPIGQVFDALNTRIAESNVVIIGLGVGSLACYAQPGQSWTFL
jgi:hypothetical protein